MIIHRQRQRKWILSIKQSIHQTYLKVLADLLHHLQLSFISWKLKDRMSPLIKPANDIVPLFMAISMCSAGTLRSYQFYFQRPDWSKGTSTITLTLLTRSHRHALSQTHVPLTGLKNIALITSPMLSTSASSEQSFIFMTPSRKKFNAMTKCMQLINITCRRNVFFKCVTLITQIQTRNITRPYLH